MVALEEKSGKFNVIAIHLIVVGHKKQNKNVNLLVAHEEKSSGHQRQ